MLSTRGGLYGITSVAIATSSEQILSAVEPALSAGLSVLQYRDKSNDADAKWTHARALQQLCRGYGVPLIINDDVELALAVGAAGVHLGAGDGSIAQARARLGARAAIGATCGDSLERAEQAVAAGASYLAFGAFFRSRTKPEAQPAPLSLLAAAQARFPAVPLCAIGGITPERGPGLIAAGAHYIAAVDAIFGAPDAAVAVRAFLRAGVPSLALDAHGVG
jgi:thiamine-phosphate pyrophosphorylase